jgi:hypothetical protein
VTLKLHFLFLLILSVSSAFAADCSKFLSIETLKIPPLILQIKDKIIAGDIPTWDYFYDEHEHIRESSVAYGELVEKIVDPARLPLDLHVLENWMTHAWDDDSPGPAVWEGMNFNLREKEKLTGEEAQLYEDLKRVLEPVPRVELVSFRGILLEPGETRRLFKRGRTFTDLGYMAASLSPWIATQFLHEYSREPLLIVLKGRTSKPIFSWMSSKHRSELEVLFEPGSRWIVEDVIGSHDADRAPNVVILSELLAGEKIPRLPPKTTKSTSIKTPKPPPPPSGGLILL